MAEDTKEVVYYKGRDYYLISRGETISEIEDCSKSTTKRIVETSSLLSKEEFEKIKGTRVSEHQMNIATSGKSKR